MNDSEAEQAREMEVHRREILHLSLKYADSKMIGKSTGSLLKGFSERREELENEISRLKSKIKNIKAECDTDDEENLRSAKSSRTAQSAKRSSISQGPRATGYVTPETPKNFSTSSSGDGRQARRVDSEVRIVCGHQQNFY